MDGEAEGRGRKADDGATVARRSPCALLALPPSSFRSSGMTLIELLITMVIMAIIAAAILGTASSAMEAGRRDRTRSTITKIHTLVMERWASYETRRADVGTAVTSEINAAIANSSLSPSQKSRALGEMTADVRLLALRETMKFEMPDRWSDVDLSGAAPTSVSNPTVFLNKAPALAQTYYRRYRESLESVIASGETQADAIDLLAQNQGAECLFLTVMFATGDGEARTMFNQQDIGDTDGDGAPEFLDGWGRPISWLRWAPGFVSRSSLMSNPPDADADHDPLDPFRRNRAAVDGSTAGLTPPSSMYPTSYLQNCVRRLRDQSATNSPGFRLVPLIYSSGTDGISDINTSFGVSVTNPGDGVYLNPYAIDSSSPPYQVFAPANFDNYEFGLPMDGDDDGDDNSKDNIHNQLIEY